MKEASYHYANMQTGYRSTRYHRTDVWVHIKFNKGKYVGSAVVYKKQIPLPLVLGLIDMYKGLPDVPTHFLGLTGSYQLYEGELINTTHSNSTYHDVEKTHAN